MKPPVQRPKNPTRNKPDSEDLFDLCIRKGLIEKTPYGYYFKPEFFETLEVYDLE
ncbi:MAG: hypothetical protein KKC68_02385 [Candidatus Thermoplasmatota archaeon]|nr:hypothetical protein [Candidatus Thermoplasmatota archaeon]MBU1940599.1 hypothetical protein [Candidatus Thermoplasmatota archaeon]